MGYVPVIALIVAVTALYIAYSNYRRSNFAVLRIHECSCTSSVDPQENGYTIFNQFRILVRNLGIPLHDVSWFSLNWKIARLG